MQHWNNTVLQSVDCISVFPVAILMVFMAIIFSGPESGQGSYVEFNFYVTLVFLNLGCLSGFFFLSWRKNFWEVQSIIL